MVAVVLGMSVSGFAASAPQQQGAMGTSAGPAMGLPQVCSLLPHLERQVVKNVIQALSVSFPQGLMLN